MSVSDAERFWGVLACPVDALADVPPQDRIYWVVRLARYLYRDLGESQGGPLHVQLEDGNLDDHWVKPDPERYEYLWDGRYERYAQAGDDISKSHKTAIQDTCERILALLRPMAERERRAAYRVLHDELYRQREPLQPGEDVELDDWDDTVDDWDDIEPGPKACAPIPCPPFGEVTLGKARPTLLWASVTRHNLETGQAGVYRWDVAGGVPFEATLPASWFDQMAVYAAATPRFPIPPEAIQADIPRIVVLPDHVTIDQAEQALIVCRDLGLLQDLPHGVMFLPAGIVS